MKFRKKPVMIEAVQWNGQDFSKNGNPDDDILVKGFADSIITFDETDLKIKTLEGIMTVSLGDYVIKGIKGELYPCKSDIFEMTYDAIEMTTPKISGCSLTLEEIDRKYGKMVGEAVLRTEYNLLK